MENVHNGVNLLLFSSGCNTLAWWARMEGPVSTAKEVTLKERIERERQIAYAAHIGAVLAANLAAAFGDADLRTDCEGTGKAPDSGRCPACDGSGLNLEL